MALSSSSGGGDLDYDDIEVQTHRSVLKATSSAVDEEADNIETITYEPAGGLARGEVAELVAVDYDYEVRMNAGGTGAFNDLQMFLSTAQWGTADDNKSPTIGPFTSKGGFDYDANFESHESVFLYLQARAAMAWQDSTNGTGGGEHSDGKNGIKNFRELLGGRGPVVTRLDELNTRLVGQVKGPMDAEAEATFITTEYWNVFESDGNII